ncbi:hypothetical protein NCC49_002770 [Naganishia albida]|nr:hypothetical protein NCC49_002770 [Naganishia albida]
MTLRDNEGRGLRGAEDPSPDGTKQDDFEKRMKIQRIQVLMNAIRNLLLILFDGQLQGFLVLESVWVNFKLSLRRIVERLQEGEDIDHLDWMIDWKNMYLEAQQVFNAWKEDKEFDEGETFARVDLLSILDNLEELPSVLLGPEWENKFSKGLVTSL